MSSVPVAPRPIPQSSGVSTKRSDDYQRSVMISARMSEHNQREMVHLVKEGVDLEYSNRSGLNLLDLAANKGASAVVCALIEAGADFTRDPIQLMGGGGYTAAHWAAVEGSERILKRWATGKGSPTINAKAADGHTPLTLALSAGRLEMADTLIALGADPHGTMGPKGEPRSLLVEMTRRMYPQAVRWCLDNDAMGADADKELALAFEYTSAIDASAHWGPIAGMIKAEIERRALGSIVAASAPSRIKGL